MPIFLNTVIFKALYREKLFIMVFWGSPLIRVNSVCGNGHIKGHSRHNLRSSVSKIMQNCVSRNGHIESKLLTQPNSMVLVALSFSSAEDGLTNGVKKTTLLAHKVLTIRRSAFLAHPV